MQSGLFRGLRMDSKTYKLKIEFPRTHVVRAGLTAHWPPHPSSPTLARPGRCADRLAWLVSGSALGFFFVDPPLPLVNGACFFGSKIGTHDKLGAKTRNWRSTTTPNAQIGKKSPAYPTCVSVRLTVCAPQGCVRTYVCTFVCACNTGPVNVVAARSPQDVCCCVGAMCVCCCRCMPELACRINLPHYGARYHLSMRYHGWVGEWMGHYLMLLSSVRWTLPSSCLQAA